MCRVLDASPASTPNWKPERTDCPPGVVHSRCTLLPSGEGLVSSARAGATFTFSGEHLRSESTTADSYAVSSMEDVIPDPRRGIPLDIGTVSRPP
jgi:hypothetical protein